MTLEDNPAGSDCCGDAAPYLLGALEREQADAFRRHLENCIVCRDEVASLQAVVDALPMAAPQLDAPASLRRRVMRDVRAEQKSARAAAGGRRRLRAWSARPVLGRPALAAGALVAAIATFGVVELVSNRAGTPQIIRASVATSSGSALLNVAHGHAELIMRHMPAPAQGKIYEVWLGRGGAQKPSPTKALFSVTSSGDGDVDVPGNLRGVHQVLVTAEPLGGSLVPTSAPVIVAQLPAE